jgi:hypothetical protein
MKKEAQSLLNNFLLQNYFIELENDIVDTRKNTRDMAEREKLYLTIATLNLLREHIYGHARHVAEFGKSGYKR